MQGFGTVFRRSDSSGFVLPRTSAPLPYPSAYPDPQPRHREVGGEEVERDEPGGGENHETCRHAATERRREAA